MSKYIELSESNREIMNSGIVLVDFWAPWCGPCRMLSPIIDQLAEHYESEEGVNICKINTDEQQEMAQEFQIRSIPTIFLIKNGELIDQLVGMQSLDSLKDKIESLK